MTPENAITALEDLGFDAAHVIPIYNGVSIPVTRPGAHRCNKQLFACLVLLDDDSDERVSQRIDNLVRTFNAAAAANLEGHRYSVR